MDLIRNSKVLHYWLNAVSHKADYRNVSLQKQKRNRQSDIQLPMAQRKDSSKSRFVIMALRHIYPHEEIWRKTWKTNTRATNHIAWQTSYSQMTFWNMTTVFMVYSFDKHTVPFNKATIKLEPHCHSTFLWPTVASNNKTMMRALIYTRLISCSFN